MKIWRGISNRRLHSTFPLKDNLVTNHGGEVEGGGGWKSFQQLLLLVMTESVNSKSKALYIMHLYSGCLKAPLRPYKNKTNLPLTNLWQKSR